MHLEFIKQLQKKYIAFEGQDGSGKSTLQSIFKEFSDYVELVNEPGSVPVASVMREILLNSTFQLNQLSELLLFMTSRNELLDKKINPIINDQGKGVISDRCYWSTYAYQLVHQSDLESIFNDLIKTIYAKQPQIDLFVYCDVKIETGLTRASKRSVLDNFEKRGSVFFEKVNQAYRRLLIEFISDSELISPVAINGNLLISNEKDTAITIYNHYVTTYNYNWLLYFNKRTQQYLLMLNTELPLELVKDNLNQGLQLFVEQDLKK